MKLFVDESIVILQKYELCLVMPVTCCRKRIDSDKLRWKEEDKEEHLSFVNESEMLERINRSVRNFSLFQHF